VLQRIEAEVFTDRGLTQIRIQPSVEVSCDSSFRNCKALQSIEFESGGLSLRIEALVFAGSGLVNAFLPDLSLFSAITAFSMRSLCRRLFSRPARESRGFSRCCFAGCAVAAVIIPPFVELIAECAFEFCCSLGSVIFERRSVLQRIESEAFSQTRSA
jgi:hypothetical protein